MAVLVTGVAGFIGFHVVKALLSRGDAVIGLDNVNSYYDVTLKRDRLSQLLMEENFRFVEGEVGDVVSHLINCKAHRSVTRIVHLAAQAGVRYSLDRPRDYVRSNIAGYLEILELARNLPEIQHLVYASSSSVYGGSTSIPFSLDDKCDKPQSLYAATKRANELMSYSYSHLFGIKTTGLRFFTVYGPWGRPDMAPMLFARAIYEGKPITLFNNGDMRRDFTYIDDVVSGVLSALDRPPSCLPPHRVLNIGNNKSESLRRFVQILEQACGRQAEIVLAPMQPGDVRLTYADIADSEQVLQYNPKISIEEGIPVFIDWFKDYYKF